MKMKSMLARDQLTDLRLQAEQFIARFSRLPSADLDTEFAFWANGKDFQPRDRSAIAREVRSLLSVDRPRLGLTIHD